MTDLFDLVAADVKLRRTTAREWHGPCPLCGGTDRFWVAPDRGRWFCRQCSPKGGDLVEYLVRVRGLTYREAFDLTDRPLEAPLPRFRPPVVSPAPPVEPSQAWRDAAEHVVRRAAVTLWSARGDRGRTYLRRRGVTEETARAWRLGFVPETVEVHGLRAVGPAIVLPWYAADRLQEVKLRMVDETDPRRRYLPLTWRDPDRRETDRAGRPHLFGADHMGERDVVVVVEGEVDVLTLHQEAHDLCAVVSLGSATATVPADVAELLRAYPRVVVATDPDPAGRAAAERLVAAVPHAVVAPPLPLGKDPNAFHCAGGSLRDWVRFVLEVAA